MSVSVSNYENAASASSETDDETTVCSDGDAVDRDQEGDGPAVGVPSLQAPPPTGHALLSLKGVGVPDQHWSLRDTIRVEAHQSWGELGGGAKRSWGELGGGAAQGSWGELGGGQHRGAGVSWEGGAAQGSWGRFRRELGQSQAMTTCLLPGDRNPGVGPEPRHSGGHGSGESSMEGAPVPSAHHADPSASCWQPSPSTSSTIWTTTS